MTLNEFLEEYEGMTPSRKHKGIEAAFKIIASDFEFIESEILAFLNEMADLEADDAFGTEGMDI